MSKINTNQATFQNWVSLIKEELAILDDEGMDPETCKIIAISNTDRLIEGQTKAGDTIRGWFLDGESARDIRWEWQETNGWPTNVSI